MNETTNPNETEISMASAMSELSDKVESKSRTKALRGLANEVLNALPDDAPDNATQICMVISSEMLTDLQENGRPGDMEISESDMSYLKTTLAKLILLTARTSEKLSEPDKSRYVWDSQAALGNVAAEYVKLHYPQEQK